MSVNYTTTPQGVSVPTSGNNGSELLAGLLVMATQLEEAGYVEAATFAGLPAASARTAGRVGYITSTGDYWRDTGSGWRFRGTENIAARDTPSAPLTVASSATQTIDLGAATVATIGGASATYSFPGTTDGGSVVQVAVGGRYRLRCSVTGAGSGGVSGYPVILAKAGATGSLTNVAVETPALDPSFGFGTTVEAEAALSADQRFQIQVLNNTGATLTGVLALRWSIERVAP